MPKSCDGLSIESVDDVLTVTLDRPALGNALSPVMVETLRDIFQALRDDCSIRSVFVRGKGAHFCTGGDVQNFARFIEMSCADRQAEFAETMQAANAMILAFASVDVPVVIACQGAVAGGGLSFLLGADVVLADPDCRLMFSHQRIALPPDGGLSILLPWAVGGRRAREIVLSSAVIPAEEALRLGVVSRIAPSDELEPASRAAATSLARGPSAAARAAKRLLWQDISSRLADQLEAERQAVIAAVGGQDFEEGVRAFLARRDPVFPTTVVTSQQAK